MFCFRFYTVKAWLNSYAETIYLVGNEDDWVVVNEIKQRKVGKPPHQLKVGRLKTNEGYRKVRRKKLHDTIFHAEDKVIIDRSTCKYIMPHPQL